MNESRSNKAVLDIAIQHLKREIPSLQGIYLFGTFGTEFQREDSDIDLAVLGAQMPESVELWNVAQDIARTIHCDVDLIDLKQASTVMRFQIITEGKRIFAANKEVCDRFELQALSRYYHFNEARKELVADYLKPKEEQ
jgi:predicted nucleotidyltransferase